MTRAGLQFPQCGGDNGGYRQPTVMAEFAGAQERPADGLECVVLALRDRSNIVPGRV
ncbi:Uncharacterised protein [Mycobacteroides abscessus subsp. abscessus]|nr:Uncharacterised protein [Mycobacteroides abscessus subsp. abscessus]